MTDQSRTERGRPSGIAAEAVVLQRMDTAGREQPRLNTRDLLPREAADILWLARMFTERASEPSSTPPAGYADGKPSSSDQQASRVESDRTPVEPGPTPSPTGGLPGPVPPEIDERWELGGRRLATST